MRQNKLALINTSWHSASYSGLQKHLNPLKVKWPLSSLYSEFQNIQANNLKLKFIIQIKLSSLVFNTWYCVACQCVIMLNNCNLNIDQNNR